MQQAVSQQQEKGQNPLGVEPIKHLLIQFAVPSIIALLVNSLYNIVDQIFIGQGVGYLGNAATTVSFPITTIALALSMLFGAGGSAYASIKLGEKKLAVAEKALGNVVSILVFMGILMLILGLIYLTPMLRLFGATDTVLPLALDYSRIILIGAPFMLIGAGLSNMARTDGSPKVAMVSMLVGAALNTVLDPVYIFIFHWGVKGAAVATITSQILSALILLYYFLRKGNMRLKAKNLPLDMSVFLGFTVLGISSCITQAASTFLQIILNNSLVVYGEASPDVSGDIALSAMGIVMKVSMILIAVNIGIGTGAQPIVGFNLGARKPDRMKETFMIAVKYATIVSIIGWILCLVFPNVILSIFGSGDAQFRWFAVKAMRVFMFGIFTSGFQIVATAYFQASGQPIKASVLSALRQVLLLIPLILILPLFFGLDGILFAGAVSDLSAGLIVFVFSVFEMKRLNGWVAETETA